MKNEDLEKKYGIKGGCGHDEEGLLQSSVVLSIMLVFSICFIAFGVLVYVLDYLFRMGQL